MEMVWPLVCKTTSFTFVYASLMIRYFCTAGSNHVYSPRHYYQPWKDPAMHRNEAEHLEEEQACHSLLVMFSNSFSAGLSGFPVLSLGDVEKSGLFQWERDSILK